MANLAKSGNDNIQDMPQPNLSASASTASTRGRRPGAPIVRRNAAAIEVEQKALELNAKQILETSQQSAAEVNQNAVDQAIAQSDDKAQVFISAFVEREAINTAKVRETIEALNERTGIVAQEGRESVTSTASQGSFLDNMSGLDFLFQS